MKPPADVENLSTAIELGTIGVLLSPEFASAPLDTEFLIHKKNITVHNVISKGLLLA